MKADRLGEIAKVVRSRGSMSTVRLAAEFGVSVATIRRDLEQLERRGLVERWHGGAVTPRRRGRAGDQGALVVGMVIPLESYYYGPVVRGANRAADVLGARLLVSITNYDAESELRIVRRMLDHAVDALVIATARSSYDSPELAEALASSPVPVVLVERDAAVLFDGELTLDSVRTMHADGARMAVRCLHDAGHRRIALISPDLYSTPELRAGYELAARELGIDPLPYPASPNWGPPKRKPLPWKLVQDLRDAGVTALIVHPEHDALDVLQGALAHGVGIPDDLAIVSYDDELSAFGEVPLTAVAPLKTQIGFQAVQRAVELCRDVEGDRSGVQSVCIPPELRVRMSS
ncbi:substrate-binding domain-containing protein [Pseudolysinimonas sp.]|uniref:LacI family DNA-binding transcriptional regulator n=1 Tax=Pseudolysinimonas sp. TaxID=2680009 RepID=UPI003F812EE5